MRRGEKRRIVKKNDIPEKAPDRLAVLERIAQLEKEGRFDVDAEEDPPTLPLEPGQIDYLQTLIPCLGGLGRVDSCMAGDDVVAGRILVHHV